MTRNQIAGDYLQLVQSGSAAGQVIDPGGRDILSLQETHRSQDIKLNLTGFYEIYTSDTETLVAVNPDIRESDPLLMSDNAISAWRDALSVPVSGDMVLGPINIQQDSIELWHILLLLMGVIILFESVIGNYFLGTYREYR